MDIYKVFESMDDKHYNNDMICKYCIQPGDVIIAVADRKVRNVSELLAAVAALKPGVAASFRLVRKEKAIDVDVEPGTRPRARSAPR